VVTSVTGSSAATTMNANRAHATMTRYSAKIRAVIATLAHPLYSITTVDVLGLLVILGPNAHLLHAEMAGVE
jgi:hypothetical protein